MENPIYPIYPINDQIPSNQPLKNKVLAQMQARNNNYLANRASISQYVPKFGEQVRLNETKQRQQQENNKFLNKAASSKIAANAMRNIVEPGIDAAMLIEGGGLAKDAIKSIAKSKLKSMSKKAVTGSAEKIGLDWKDIEKYDPAFYLKSNKIKEADQVLLDFRNRIATPEGEKRMKNLLGDRYEKVKNNISKLELKQDPSDYAYYTSGVMTDPYIGLHPELDRGLVKPIVRHEIEHAVQKGATTEVDDILSNLELKKTPNKVNWDEKKLDKQINPQNLKYKLKDRQDATDYFDSGSNGREKGAFLGELQQYMVDNKLISHPYAVNEITPSKIRDVFIDNIGQDDYPLRIFNIMKPTDNNYKIIANGLNKMLIGSGVVTGVNKINSMKSLKNEK